jgi:hypothetical protein
VDPFTGAILLGLIIRLCAKTVTSGVADAIALGRGQTPPSQERWRARQQDRARRGEKEEKEPGPWRRRWRMAAEKHATKAEQKHQAHMQHLRDNDRYNVAKHKDRLQRRADRRRRIAEKLHDWADGARNKIRDRHQENQAWNDNENRDADPVDPVLTDPAAAAPGEAATPDTSGDRLADVLPFPGPHTGEGDADKPPAPGEGCMWIPEGKTEPCGKPPRPGGPYCTVHFAIGRYTECQWHTHHNGAPRCRNPRERHQSYCTTHLAEESKTREAEVNNVKRCSFTVGDPGDPNASMPCGNEAKKDGIYCDYHDSLIPPIGGQQPPPAPPVNTDPEGKPEMTTANHSGEITDLPSAIAYCKAGVKYCDLLSSKFEQTKSQTTATINDLRRQASTLENAQATLTGQGFGTNITGRFGTVGEHYSTLLADVQAMEQQLASVEDKLTAARAELNSAATVFQNQLGISEEVQAHQKGDVAKSTDFYANA